MNPLIGKYIGAILRLIFLVVGLKLDLSDEQLNTAIEVLTVVGVGAWSIRQKYRSQKVTNTAIASPNAKTVDEVKAIIKTTGGAPAMVPADAQPVIGKGN